MTSRIVASILLAIGSTSPSTLHATVFPFTFTGPGVSGSLSITYDVNPNTGPLGTSPNTVDPVGSYIITGITGTFSDTALGIANAVVTGLTPLNRVAPETTNLLAPNSFSLLTIANGVDLGNGHPSPGYHYDNLFYPGGSPQTASDYPLSGGVFDIYGMVFTLDNGDFVNFWSNGGVPPTSPDYGVAVTDGVDVLSYVDSGVSIAAVPEPATWAMMIVGFGLAGFALRRRRTVATTVRFA